MLGHLGLASLDYIRNFNVKPRRIQLGILLGTLPSWAGCCLLVDRIGGDFAGPPEALWSALEAETRGWIRAAFEDSPAGTLADFHVHLGGLGRDDTGA